MSSREDILQNIRRNTRVRYEKPDLSDLEHEALTYEDTLMVREEVSPILLPDVPTRSCSSDCIFGKQKRIPGRVVHKYTPFLPQAALSLFAALRYP